MNQRIDRLLRALIVLTGLLFSTAYAQIRPIEEGFDYRVLPMAQAVESKGKIEVIEFF